VQLLGLDLGTTTFKAIVYGEGGDVRAQAAVSPVTRTRRVAGTPIDFWPAAELWTSICAVTREAAGQLEDSRIDCLSIGQLGLVGLPVGKDGEPLYDAVAWMNPADPMAGFDPSLIDEKAMFASTGNRLNPIYPPIWISWLRTKDPSYPQRQQKWLCVGDYLAYRMTGVMAMDYSMASQNLVLDQRSLSYRTDLLEALRLPVDLFAEPRNAGEQLGPLRPEAAAEMGLDAGTLVVLGGADFVTGAYASGLVNAGDSAIITGTWENTVFCSEQPKTDWAVAEVGAICDHHIMPGRWSTRIETFSGDITEWWRREVYSRDGRVSPWSDVMAEAESASPGSGGVVFLPHLSGRYGPVVDERATGAFVGITNRTTRGDLSRAVFEGLCYQSRHAVEILAEALHLRASRLVTMGGATRNPLWMQTRADVLGSEVDIVVEPDVSARGAAMTAAVGIGLFADYWEAAKAWALPRTTVTPSAERAERYDELYRLVYRPLCEDITQYSHALRDITARREAQLAPPAGASQQEGKEEGR
jgi:xylulokinase